VGKLPHSFDLSRYFVRKIVMGVDLLLAVSAVALVVWCIDMEHTVTYNLCMDMKEFTSKEILAIRHIRNSLAHYGGFPSIRELRDVLGYKSVRSAQDILETLQEQGIVQKQAHGRYILVTEPDFGTSHASTIDVPIVGTAACGAPLLAQQNIEGYIPVSTSLAKSGFKYFLLHAKGDSMDEAGIMDGDLVLVKQQSTARDKDLVVALIDDEATIKEFHVGKGIIILKPRSYNPEHRPIILEEEFRIQGVVITSIPNLN
jgi:repressor LexA